MNCFRKRKHMDMVKNVACNADIWKSQENYSLAYSKFYISNVDEMWRNGTLGLCNNTDIKVLCIQECKCNIW